MSEFPEDWQEVAWAKLPPELRQRAVNRLREVLGEAFFEEWRQRTAHGWPDDDQPPGTWHFGQGMWIRNALRSNVGLDTPPAEPPIKDGELPGLPELYGQDSSTWDDFYIACIEAAAGIRDL